MTLKKALFKQNCPVWVWQAYDNQFSVNSEFKELLGFNPESLTGFLNHLHSDSREQLLAAVGRALRNRKPFCLSIDLLAPHEHTVPLWCVCEFNSDGQPVLVGSMLLNSRLGVTEEDSADFQAIESKLLLDTIDAAIWHLDRWGVVQHANQRATGWAPLVDSLGKTVLEIPSCWVDAAEHHREIMQVIRTGRPVLEHIEVVEKGGQKLSLKFDKVPTLSSNKEVTGVMLVVTDVTAELIKEQELRDSEARYRVFVANSSEAMFRFDIDPPVTTTLNADRQIELLSERLTLAECNQAFADLFAVEDSAEMIASNQRVDLESFEFLNLSALVASDYRLQNQEFEWVIDGRNNNFNLSLVAMVEQGALTRIWGVARNITEDKRYLDRLEYQAMHDSLTKLANRAKLYRELEISIDRCVSDTRLPSIALLLLDLDRFKEINDTLGHHAGDKLLKLIGPRLEMELAEYPAVVARLGGDEFAILLKRVVNAGQATKLAGRVLEALKQPFEIDGLQTEISASVGVALCPEQASDVSTLMRFADVSMYHAKSERLGVSLYDNEIDRHTPKRLALMGDLGKAIRENQLELHFQPKINTHSKRIFGFEALLRWNHPELGAVPPAEFIPLVEMTDLIHPMTRWVVEHSIKQAKKWIDTGHHFSVAANLSVQNLLGEDLVKVTRRLLQRYSLPPQMLEYEITESTIMADPDRALRVLDSLHEMGVTLAIDDFGTGYSSLAYLKRLPVKTLKIDREFVQGMLEDEHDEIIVNSTINLAHNLGLKVVAEGVEDSTMLERLQQLGCDAAQGYFIAKPQSAIDVEAWLSNTQWY